MTRRKQTVLSGPLTRTDLAWGKQRVAKFQLVAHLREEDHSRFKILSVARKLSFIYISLLEYIWDRVLLKEDTVKPQVSKLQSFN